MIEKIQEVLNSIAPSFEDSVPDQYMLLPNIIHYQTSPKLPLYFADNKASKERVFYRTVEVWDSEDISALAIQIEEGLSGIKGVLRSEEDISENGLIGYRFTFEFYQF